MVITVRDAAKLLNVPRKTIERWIREEKIPYHKSGEQYVFERLELFQFAVNEHLNPMPVLADFTGEEDLCSFHDALMRGGIFHNVGGTTKKEVLYNAMSQINGLDRASLEPLFELFMVREELASTGIGDGIAIPHARGPLIGYVNAPLVSLSFLEHPIEYGALDGKPVQVLFLIVSPTVRIHLRLLGQLAFSLHAPECREAILRHDPPQSILGIFQEMDSRCQGSLSANR